MAGTFFEFEEEIISLSQKALEKCKNSFEYIDKTTEYNQQKVLSAFIENRVSDSHFAPSTGYGYDDRGRDTLDKVFAKSLGGFYSKVDLGIVKYHFEVGAGTENFRWA